MILELFPLLQRQESSLNRDPGGACVRLLLEAELCPPDNLRPAWLGQDSDVGGLGSSEAFLHVGLEQECQR